MTGDIVGFSVREPNAMWRTTKGRTDVVREEYKGKKKDKKGEE